MRRHPFLLSFLLLGFLSCEPGSFSTDYNEPWNTPTYNYKKDSFKYVFSGMIGYRDRGFAADTLVFPPIPGLIHQSSMSLCPADTCYSEYAVLALRCPKHPVLLKWVSKRAKDFADGCTVGDRLESDSENSRKDIPFRRFKNVADICSYYMGELDKVYQNWSCSGERDHDMPNEQCGLVLADCWQQGRYVTFYEGSWYDWVSCGDTTREHYITVDSKTGKELKLSDFIPEEQYNRLDFLMEPRLYSVNGDAYQEQYEERFNVLDQYSSIALIREGLVITFDPYVLGCGADGEYKAIIPYEELKGVLNDCFLPQ